MTPSTPSQHLTTARIRMSDSAILAGCVSLLYAFFLMVWPTAFPHLLARVYYGGYFYRTLAVLLVAANEILFAFIFKRRNQKPNPMTAAYIALLTVTLVFGLRAVLMVADEQAQLAHFLQHSATHGGVTPAELLVYTHLGIVSGIFLPYLVVRLTQNYTSATQYAELELKARHTTAGL